MNIAICDEKNGDKIKAQILCYMKENCIKNSCFVFNTAVDLMVSSKAFDIVILSASFSEISSAKISGYFKRYNKEVAIIVIADDYSHLDDAFDIGAIRFLVYPIDDALFPALDCAINHLNTETMDCYLENNGTIKKVSKSSILYLEISGRKTKIVTDKECYYSRFKMQDFQKALSPTQFASPHKSFYVNLGQITECRRFGGQYYLCMSDNKYIPITRTRKAEFEKAYYQFIENKKLT